MENINEDIIHLQNAHVTQYTNKNGKSSWKVRKNISSQDLFDLPSDLTEEEIFKVMEFARLFEDIAFNKGINLGKNKSKKIYESIIERLENNIKLAREENIRLATKLEQFIVTEE